MALSCVCNYYFNVSINKDISLSVDISMANCDIYTTVSAELPCVHINLHAYLCMDVCVCVYMTRYMCI